MSDSSNKNSNPDLNLDTEPNNNPNPNNKDDDENPSNSGKQSEVSSPAADDAASHESPSIQMPPPPLETPPTPPQRSLPPQPHELTAEWTVRAQLRFARAGERVQREFSSNDPVNPVRVVYKWSTSDTNHENVRDDDDADDVVDEDDATSCNTSIGVSRKPSFRQSTSLKQPNLNNRKPRPSTKTTTTATDQRHESFRSTTSSTNVDLGGGDSAFSSSNTSNKKSPKEKSTTRSKQAGRETGAAQATTTTTSGGRGTTMYGTRCRSTCNIVVSAVADFLPVDAAVGRDHFMTTNTNTTTTGSDFIPEEETGDPFIYHTSTPCYTVLPEKSCDDVASTASKNCTSFGKILDLRDAFCQTSDTETKYFEEKRRSSNNQSPGDRRNVAQRSLPSQPVQQRQQQQQRKPYEQRRATTDALMSQPTSRSAVAPVVDEGNSFTPSFAPPSSQTVKSASLPRIPPLSGQKYQQQQQQELQEFGHTGSTAATAEPQKKPRTVHIDVYCTGSDDDDEDQADGESSSSVDETGGGSTRHELDSNSTPQTVLENEQMLVRHQRVTGQALPRRINQKKQQQQHRLQPSPFSQQKASSTLSSPSELHVGHAITKSSTAEEVCESKQLLFRKHIGDQRAAKLQNLRQKYMRQPSDEVLSSNYPNSSRSTMRDATCSSICSAVPSSPADYVDSYWKGTDEADDNYSHSLAKSDSFEYENAVDRLRIKQMERFWSSHGGLGASSPDELLSCMSPSHTQSSLLQTIAEGNPSQLQRQNTFRSESENFSEAEALGALSPSQQTAQRLHLHQTPHFMRNRPGFLQFFGPPTPSPEPIPQTTITKSEEPMSAPVRPTTEHLLFPQYGQHLQRWKSEARDNLSDAALSPSGFSSQRSSPQPERVSTLGTPQRCGSEVPSVTPTVTRLFEMKQQQRQESPLVNESSFREVPGYTREYLEKARKFGNVVSTVRKPGHHVGPTKNPSCLCESCQRWLAERFQLRGRTFSLDERPVLKKPT